MTERPINRWEQLRVERGRVDGSRELKATMGAASPKTTAGAKAAQRIVT